MASHLQYLSLALYAASFLCYLRFLYVSNPWAGRTGTLLLAAGILVHYFALLERSHGAHSIPYGDLYGSMSLFAWLLGLTYLGLEFIHRQRTVGSFVTLLLVVWMAALDVLAPHQIPATPPARGALFDLHITLNTWAYAAFALAFVLSLVYLVQHRVLRSRRPSATFWRFPALDVLDRMSRSSVWVGLGTLGVGVLIALIWERRLVGAFSWLDPKVIVTVAIVAVYIAYLRLSRSPGWRGARAAMVCALNFVVVLFSYTVVNLYLTRFHRF